MMGGRSRRYCLGGLGDEGDYEGVVFGKAGCEGSVGPRGGVYD